MLSELDLHKQAQEMLQARAKKFQVQISRLNEQLAAQHKQKMIEQRKVMTIDQKQALLESEQVIAQLELRTQDLEGMVRQAQEEAMIAEGQLQDTRMATKAILGLQEEALTLLLMCIEDVKVRYQETLAAQEKARAPPMFPPINGGNDQRGTVANAPQPVQDNIFLSDLSTVKERELFLEIFTKKLATFTPEQIAILTQ